MNRIGLEALYAHTRVFQVALVVKNLPDSAGEAGSIPGSERSSTGGHDNPFQYSCLRIPWTEEPGSWGCKELDRTKVT